MTIQKRFFFVKHVVLIFPLVRTRFLSSYKNIVLIFSLVKTVVLSIYKNIVRFLGRQSKFKKHKALKKREVKS